MMRPLVILSLCGLGAVVVHAGPPPSTVITVDWKTGSPVTISPVGTVYTIDASVGQTRGNNLFHSFGQFDLSTGDTATFTGPSTIKNIIARVIGGSASTIDGTIDTTAMPNANFFFINPFGVIFGPNAVINVGGSFAVTTASYVKLADGGRFDARNPANDILTAAPVSAFGFLGPTFAPITFDGPTDPEAAFILAYLPDGKSIWIVGGDIQHQGSYLAAPGGEIVMVSVASAGELAVNVDDPRASVDTTPFATLGSITLNNATEYVDGSPGQPGGQVVMEANRISFVNNSGISDGNNADTTGGDIILRARSEIDISDSTVGSVAYGIGDSGNFFLTAPTIQLTTVALGETTLGTDINSGRAGNVVITATDFSFLGSGGITVASQGAGAGGNLTINADKILIQGPALFAKGIGSGSPGSVTIQGKTTEQANTVELLAGGQIISDVSAEGVPGGTIHITAKSLTIDDQHGSGLTSISSQSEAGGGGGGNIILDVGRLEVLNGAQITAVTQNSAPAGSVTVHGNEVLVAGRQSHGQGSVITSASQADGAAGGITLQLTGSLTLRDGGLLSVSAAQSAGGDITVNAGGDIRLTGGRITGVANQDGGNVRLMSPSLTYLLNSTVTAASTAGNGGNVFLDPALVILNHSTIAANALLNNGGNISIVSDFFLPSASRLDASGGPAGIQGTVLISAPSLDLAGNFVELPDNLVDASSLLTPHCAIRRPRGASSFTSIAHGALPPVPDGLLPALP